MNSVIALAQASRNLMQLRAAPAKKAGIGGSNPSRIESRHMRQRAVSGLFALRGRLLRTTEAMS